MRASDREENEFVAVDVCWTDEEKAALDAEAAARNITQEQATAELTMEALAARAQAHRPPIAPPKMRNLKLVK